MPWWSAPRDENGVRKDVGWPDHYQWPLVLSDATVLGHHLDYAKSQRKKIGQIRESVIATQKQCGKDRDIENARFLSDMGADLMKQYRGWNAGIKMIEDEEFTKWPRIDISEQIAPYVDRAFDFMGLQE